MKTDFRSNPSLPFVKEGIKGNCCFDNRFANGNAPEHDFLSKVFRWMFSANPQRKEKKNERYVPEIHSNDTSFIHSGEDGILWLGHSTFLIRIDGVTILTDPIFRNIPFVKRKTAMPFPATALTGIDYVLLSHAHRDHFDVASLKQIARQNPQAEYLIPMCVGKLLTAIIPQARFQEAAWWQQYKVPSLDITFLPAKHWHKRGTADFNVCLWGSFMIRGKHRSVYFAGDTAYNSHFKELQAHYHQMDICLMPIGAYKPSFLMQQSHTSPEEAVQACNELKGAHFVPMHYATYDLADEPMGEPIRKVRGMKEDGTLQANLHELVIGRAKKLEAFN